MLTFKLYGVYCNDSSEQTINNHTENNMAIRELTPEDKVYVRPILYPAGVTEEGHPFEAEGFQIVVERLDGHRIVNDYLFDGVEWVDAYDPDYGDTSYWGDIREEAKAKAEDVVHNIIVTGVLNLDHWMEAEPKYGSSYYCICNDC